VLKGIQFYQNYRKLYCRIACCVCVFGFATATLSAQNIHYFICSSDTFLYPLHSDGANYKIDFGDGGSDSSSQPIKHLYANNGNYTIIIIKSLLSKKDTIKYKAHVGSLPPLKFSSKPFCSRFEFKNACPDTVVVNGGWAWNFGDGSTSTYKSPSHIFKNAGTYKVTLEYGIKSPCNHRLSSSVTVKPALEIGFDSYVNGNSALFQPVDTAAVHYHWDFGDKDTTDSISPIHTYHANGKYPVSLITQASNGCTSYYADTLTASSAGIKTANANINVFNAYPNPFLNTLIIHYELKSKTNVNMYLYNALGQLAYTLSQGSQHFGRYDIEFHPAEHGIKPGMYVLIAYFGEVYLTQRLIMQQ